MCTHDGAVIYPRALCSLPETDEVRECWVMQCEKEWCYGCSCVSLQEGICVRGAETHELNFSQQLGISSWLGKQRGIDCTRVHRHTW